MFPASSIFSCLESRSWQFLYPSSYVECEDKMENCREAWELLWVQAAGLCTPSWWGFSVSRDRRCPGRHLTVRGYQELGPVRGKALYKRPSKPRGDPARWLVVYSQSYFSFQGHESHSCSLKPETDFLARRHHKPWLGVTHPGHCLLSL